MTEKEFIIKKISDLEDEWQHFEMVEHDNVKSKIIKDELEHYKKILLLIEDLLKGKNNNEKNN